MWTPFALKKSEHSPYIRVATLIIKPQKFSTSRWTWAANRARRAGTSRRGVSSRPRLAAVPGSPGSSVIPITGVTTLTRARPITPRPRRTTPTVSTRKKALPGINICTGFCLHTLLLLCLWWKKSSARQFHSLLFFGFLSSSASYRSSSCKTVLSLLSLLVSFCLHDEFSNASNVGFS